MSGLGIGMKWEICKRTAAIEERQINHKHMWILCTTVGGTLCSSTWLIIIYNVIRFLYEYNALNVQRNWIRNEKINESNRVFEI